MIIKICGITNAEDAAAAIADGANAIGFNFYPSSPRYIAPERAAEIPTATGVRRVGIFVNESPARVEEIARLANLDIAQLHGQESPTEYPARIPVWKAARITAAFNFAALAETPAEAILLDGPASGIPFDWHATPAISPLRIILAGGLDAANVSEAISITHPWGVDACSRIELTPGIKDHQKMQAFIRAARKALQP